MPTYASFTGARHAHFLTPGKRYPVVDADSRTFAIRDDENNRLACDWQGCGHLSGGDWTRHYEPTPYTPGPRQAIAERPRASVSPDHSWEPKPDTPPPLGDTTGAPSLLRDMTDAEIGALVRAFQEGKEIEFWGDSYGDWVDDPYPDWDLDKAYRIKPEPVRKTVPLYTPSSNPSLIPVKVGTIDRIDGVLQPDTFKLL